MDDDFVSKHVKLETHELIAELVITQTHIDVVLDLIYAWENSKYGIETFSISELLDKIKEKLDPTHTWKPYEELEKE